MRKAIASIMLSPWLRHGPDRVGREGNGVDLVRQSSHIPSDKSTLHGVMASGTQRPSSVSFARRSPLTQVVDLRHLSALSGSRAQAATFHDGILDLTTRPE